MILHGHTNIQNFSLSVKEYSTSECCEQGKHFFHNEKRNIFLHSTIKKIFAAKDAKMTFCYFARESTPGISFLFI